MNEALLSSKKTDWCTPADFFAELDREFHFNLDPAATAKSAKCERYFTPAEDGLSADWGGSRVFCNPPYGRQIGAWVRKGWEESRKPGTLVVMLIPARTDTAYFHNYIFDGKADEVRFLRGRLIFTDEDGAPTTDDRGRPCAAPFPSAVVIWRSPELRQLKRPLLDYDVLELAVRTFGEDMQVDKCIEECSELTKALLKYRQMKKGFGGNKAELIENILEELADCEIMLEQMKIVYVDPTAIKREKLKRLTEKIQEVKGVNDKWQIF